MHVIFMMPYLRKQIIERGLEKPIDKGRIYRIVHEGKPLGPRPQLVPCHPPRLLGCRPAGSGRASRQAAAPRRRLAVDGAAPTAPFARRLGRESGGPRLAGVPIVLETPKEGPDGKPTPANNRRNLALLRRLAAR